MHVMLRQAICAYLERQCELLVYIFGPDPTSSNEKGSSVTSLNPLAEVPNRSLVIVSVGLQICGCE